MLQRQQIIKIFFFFCYIYVNVDYIKTDTVFQFILSMGYEQNRRKFETLVAIKFYDGEILIFLFGLQINLSGCAIASLNKPFKYLFFSKWL